MRTATLPRATGPTARPVKTSKPTNRPTGLCSLTLSICGTKYKVRPLPAEFGGIKAFRLTKTDGEFHDVARHVYGCECTCGDFVYRRNGIDESGCKHIRSMRALGLMD